MRTLFLWMSVFLASLAAGARDTVTAPPPAAPPPLRKVELPSFDRVIREAIAIHNVEWRRYRREWFELGQLTFRPSAPDRDASYVLAKFLHRTTERPETIHVDITGRPLEVYTSGTHAMPVGGLA